MGLTLTLDTNCLDHPALREAAARADADVAVFSVSRKELKDSSFAVYLTSLNVLPEQTVWADGFWADGLWADRVWASGPSISYETKDGAQKFGDPFEAVLQVISNGAFPRPGARKGLSSGQQRQFRDAMILSLHAQQGRDVFVSADERAFIADGRRAVLERMLHTRIRTPDEAIALLS